MHATRKMKLGTCSCLLLAMMSFGANTVHAQADQERLERAMKNREANFKALRLAERGLRAFDPPQGGVAGEFSCDSATGDCCSPHEGIGCETPACCDCVCALDSFCCETFWDNICVDQAIADCPSECGCPLTSACGLFENSCCEAGSVVGCNNSECCNCVCDTDAFCCSTEWDDLCATQELAPQCYDVCGCPGSCCESSIEIGPDGSVVVDSQCNDNETSVSCLDTGGTFGGPGTTCADNGCLGGCCISTILVSTCVSSTESACTESGFTYLGNGDFCADPAGSDPRCVGACCTSDGGCDDTVGQAQCELGLGGTFLGTETTCAEPQPCCYADTDTCVMLDPGCCVASGGIVDTEGPTPDGGCPDAELTVECGDPTPPFEVTFTDNCDTSLLIEPISSINFGKCTGEFIIDRDTTATDNCGNQTTCSQIVNIVDTTSPTFLICANPVVVECINPSGFPVDFLFLESTATDTCTEPSTCCHDNATSGCDDAACETAVCACDPYCCEVYWDDYCAGTGFFGGCGAEILCGDLCTGVEVIDNRPEFYFPPTCGGDPTVVTFTAIDDCGNETTCETQVAVIGSLCCPSTTDTDLKLMITDLDLRQDNEGPGNTKARFDIWNSNEVRFSGTERCIICWDETLISDYGPIANHLIIENLQTDKGKARIQNEASTVCPESTDAALLGVAIQETQFAGSPYVEMRSAVTLVGMGEQAARIQYDIIEEPEEATGGELQITNDELPNGGLVSPVGTGPSLNDSGTSVAGGVADNRASTTFKGSLVSWPVIEVKWDAYGTLIQDTFITVVNDNPGQVKIQFYQVNGDAPLDPVIDQNSMELIERGHPGWNWSDYQITLTGDESAYWSVASGLPKGVSPISVLDSGNPNGRPDLDPTNPGGRVIRGFLVGWAVNDNGQEIRWNHLTGHAISIRYDQATAFDYNPWNFRVVSGVPEGAQSDGDPGNLNLDGVEYDYAPETLLFDFFAAGSQALSHPAVRDLGNHDEP